MNQRGHLSNENLGIGTATWACLAEFEETHNIKPFVTAMKRFYVETIKKVQIKFPFDD